MSAPQPKDQPVGELIAVLTSSLVHHYEQEHPDPDMTEACKFKADVDLELTALCQAECNRAREEEARLAVHNLAERRENETWEQWSWRVVDYFTERLQQLMKEGES